MTRDDCIACDRAHPLAPLREQFVLPAGKVYLDGNSLGALPKAAAARVVQVLSQEWGEQLIESWNSAGWIDLPQRIGDKIGRLVGAAPGELVVADSTSVNLFKVLSAALGIVAAREPSTSQRRTIVSERGNFPTDLYIAESLARERGFELRLVDAPEAIEPALATGQVAVLMLTQVDYRSGRLHDMAALTQLAHPRHADAFVQPLSGWMGHAAPFEFTPSYRPAAGIARYLCGTPALLSMAALECGVDSVLTAEAHGGLPALRAKSLALTDLFIERVEQRCAGFGLAVVTPRTHELRGSQVSLSRAEGAHAIVQALIAREVIGDFRAPDVLRFGFTPLYLRFVDVWDAVEHLHAVLAGDEWRDPRFARKAAVT